MVEDKPKGNTQNGFKEQWRQRFEYFASRYDDDAGIAGWSDTGLKTRLRFFLKAWNADSSRNFWLDVGCGAGTYSKILLKARKKVLALDYSYPTLIKAREKVETSQDIQWILADATNLPLKKEAVDGVLALGVSQALPDSEDLVAELMQTLQRYSR